jgi:hypothetical protein
MYVAAWMLAIMKVKWRTALFHTLVAVADPESFHWVGIQYRNSALQYATVLTTVLRYLGRRESGVVLGLPEMEILHRFVHFTQSRVACLTGRRERQSA